MKQTINMTINFVLFSLTFYATSIKGYSNYQTSVAIKRGIQDFTNSIPIGIETYTELVKTSKLFVDNSFLINELVTNETQVRIMMGPRKFGKSLNLDMIKTFFDIQTYDNGTAIPLHSTFGYNLFRKGKILLNDGSMQELEKPLLISRCAELMHHYQGRVPVIHIDFKQVTGNNYAAVEKNFYLLISRLYKKYAFIVKLMDSVYTESRFENIIQGVPDRFVTLGKSVEFLAEVVYKYYKREPLIIFENYDAPLSNIIYCDDFPRNDIKHVVNVTLSLIRNTFERNLYLWRGIMVGQFKVLGRLNDTYDIFCEQDYVGSTLDLCNMYLGFNAKDVQVMYEKHQIPENLSELADLWYNGYHSHLSTHRFYNPYSMVNFLKTKQIQNYWNPGTAREHIIKRYIGFEDGYMWVLRFLSKQFFYSKHQALDEASISYLKTLDGCTMEWFLGFLLNQGYLTTRNVSDFVYVQVKLPNRETSQIMSDWVVNYMQGFYKFQENLLNDAVSKLLNFINNDATTDTELEKSLTNLYSEYTFLQKGLSVNEVFNYITLRMQRLLKFDVDIRYIQTRIADTLIANNRTKRGVIIELRRNFEGPIEYDVEVAEGYKLVFTQLHYNCTIFKFMAVKLSWNRPCKVLAKIDRNQTTLEEFNKWKR